MKRRRAATADAEPAEQHGGVHVRADRITVRIAGIDVLGDIDVEIGPGALTAVVGPSGSGKTTLLNVLGGLQTASAGSVYFDDLLMPASAIRTGIVTQSFALLSLLTAAENVELVAQLRGLPRAEVDRAATRCLAATDMLDRAEHLIDELSGGEQQRVAISRALVGEPQLLLADEPTAHLDQRNRDNVIGLLRRMADAGTTVVIATHDPDVAARCDAVVELRSGRLTRSGPVDPERRGRTPSSIPPSAR